jgi:hypothetical protein
MDDYSRRTIIAELEANLRPMQQEFGAPIPADYVKAAINASDAIGNFPGEKLIVSAITPQPDPAFFNRLCGQLRCVYMSLLKNGITATKQDIEAVFPNLQQGLIASTKT